MRRYWKRWIVVAAVVLAAGVVGGPFVYIHFIEGKAPAPLAVSNAAAHGNGAATSIDGTWKIESGSQAGYRVQEVLFGQSTTAVGRTSGVTGSLTATGTKILKGAFTVDMTTVTSDKSQRDGQFRGRIMDTASYPQATFTLTQPIDLAAVPATGVKATAKATGDLKLKDTTRQVTFDVTAERTADGTAEVSGSIPVKFADWNIANPSFGPVQTQDNGQVEFLLRLTKG